MSEGYKITELGYIPVSWDVVRLEQYVNIVSGCSPSGLAFSATGRFNFYKVNQLNDFEKYMHDSPFKFDRGNLVSKGAVIFPKRGASIFTNKIRMLSEPAFFDTNVMSLETRKELDNEFLFYYLQDFKLSRIADTSSIPQINNKHINPLLIRLPSLPEQQKIASILSTVDEKIAIIDAQISQTQELKKGLMQQLLSKGIGHTKFKNSELGDIPENWRVKYIKDFSQITTGSKDTQNKIYDGLYPFIVRSQKVERINSYSFDGEAVLTAGDGVGVGKVFHYMNEKFDYHQRVYNIHSFKPEVLGRYFYEYFKHFFHFQVRKYNAKGSVDSVRMEMISKMIVAIPPVDEQKKIASIFSKIDEKLSSLNSRKAIYQQLKKGLMQQLLTGKIRVNTSQNEPALA